ncbi:MAG TPA: phage portal protein, partial [Methyloceanibacter sp.]|nr:phage portal protein [Methyloceanibacter sp.]
MPTSLRSVLARLFGRMEAKASKTAKLVAFASGGQPVWTPRDFTALAREGFAKNPIVYRSVRMIAEAAASVPLFLFDGER